MIAITGILAIFALTGASAQSFNGEKEPIDNQTCISIRLPWQEAPIFFCTEKENIKYKERCSDHFARYCRTENSPKTLQVATPWDCCALTSTPDYCSDVSCPAAPFNRSCTEVPKDSKTSWGCCPYYFCEEGSSSCPMKRLQPDCLSSPKTKANCTAFKDPHGCCNKFQCAGEGKPGMCPMEVQALNLKAIMESGKNGTLVSISSNSSRGQSIHESRSILHTRFGRSTPHALMTTEMQCVGDYTCPGQMKCCSMHMSAYYDSSVNKKMTRRSGVERAINGYCMEPVNDSL